MAEFPRTALRKRGEVKRQVIRRPEPRHAEVFGRALCQTSCRIMPAAMATTNTSTSGDSVARLSSAGPGHKPTRPQPIPNSR